MLLTTLLSFLLSLTAACDPLLTPVVAFGCEFCYFTPTREAADLGGQRRYR